MTRLALAVLGLAALAFAAPALACPTRTTAGDERAVRELENQWIGNHDRAALERILADDFRHPVFTGDVLTKRQHIDWAVSHPLAADRRPRFASLTIRLYRDTALAEGSVEMVDRQNKVLNRNLFTDVFVYRACRWQAISAQETDIAPPVQK